MKVLYITGWCRSGSTLLGNILGELPRVAHVGELSYLWSNGVLGIGTNPTCGCGEDLRACRVWGKVLSLTAADETALREVAAERVRRHQAHLRTRHTRRRLAEARGRPVQDADVRETLAAMTSLYETAAEVLGADVLVDSSKFPAEAAALFGLDGIDAYALHLVRDPRATAYSWRRAKAYIPAMDVRRSTAYWTGFNIASEWIGEAFPGRYRRLRYEDFAAEPARVLAALGRWAGLPGTPPVTAGGVATLGENHTVTGNPDRLQRGEVRIRPDNRWIRGLPRGEALTGTVIAAPLLGRYRYPLLPAPTGR
ncbi:sulfotransferase [Actinomadura rudentiformis]|uniref:Sulfotransferase n=1 Tax=Actinomadura rudentiformis TaxID=359158 RepID=A0A6H9YKL7_9ACTN|nr:sulfotransferase [Actinomadura rudentiformis]KAB2341633.1 sulfotransferase [Actinomadura rudentiformis]